MTDLWTMAWIVIAYFVGYFVGYHRIARVVEIQADTTGRGPVASNGVSVQVRARAPR